MAVSRKKFWSRVFFLGVTITALATECWFAWDGDPETDPWTDLIGDYVPWQAALAVFGALLLWVPAHFYVRFKRELAEQRAKRALLVAELDSTKSKLRQVNILLESEGIGREYLVDPNQDTLF